jgi:hypothetical protein
MGAGDGTATRASPGYSTIELMVSFTVLALALSGIWGLAGTASRITLLYGGRLDAQQGARRALERIIEELRWADSVVPDPGCLPAGLCADRVRVRIPPGNPYRRDQGYEVVFQHNSRQREVERLVAGGVNNLAALVDRVVFTYLDASGQAATAAPVVTRVRVALTLAPRAGHAVTVETEVGLRNRRVLYVRPSSTLP